MLDKLNLFFLFPLVLICEDEKTVKVTSCHHNLLILLTTDSLTELDYIIDM